MAQISNGISNPVIAGIIYWLIRILICGGCLVGAGILVAFIEIKIAGLYKKCCWDMITILVTLISMAIAIYFGRLDKDSLADQYAISLIIGATGICWNQVVCKGMARNKGISLKQKYRYFIGTICLYFRANIYYHISTKGESI